MSTLRERVAECERRNPTITRAEIARAAGVKQPSVTDWFNGSTTRLRLAPAVKAAAVWGRNPLWLGEGEGLPQWRSPAAGSALAAPAPPTLDLAHRGLVARGHRHVQARRGSRRRRPRDRAARLHECRRRARRARVADRAPGNVALQPRGAMTAHY